MTTIARLTLSALATIALLLAASPPAVAKATDAVDACGATDRGDLTATVPPEVQSKIFMTVTTSHGPLPVRCGNGVTTGAVHIEVKHRVPNWGDALSCIKKVIDRTPGQPNKNGKTNYALAVAPGNVFTVVRGDIGIITAYPSGGDLENKWRQCSVS
ncbi:MAG TPA: hypothetical protein VK735_13775 [Pseudonocardia sp.]|uniref:hypothetical protein n=1 Tax=Pseudonocardia sp. TaxID=60912 RepID=UPI002C9C6F60|nr:hypothetical protein [Pseudonocardia sp.]HTF48513.1 hypothetical protein [Pseudonocardia sp.]